MPVHSSPLLNIDLPQPIVLPTLHLTGLYACMLGIDYVLIRYQDRLYISKSTLKASMTVIHALVPLGIVSPYLPNNVGFAAVPWFIASYSAYLPTAQFTIKEWIRALYSTIVDRTAVAPEYPVKRMGLVKCLRGIVKLSILYFGIEPLLPTMPDEMLDYPWLSKESLLDTFLFGLKAYLVLGFVDITSGLAQAVTGWRMTDMFNNPLLSTSPRDFWSHRWNLTVRNLLHSQVFQPQKIVAAEKKEDDKKKGFFSTRAGRGLLAFLVSGAFHELIICSVCRKLTLENFCFFTFHGLACLVECTWFQHPSPQGWRRVRNNIALLGFMTLTGRLFLAPFLRTRFTHVLPLTQF